MKDKRVGLLGKKLGMTQIFDGRGRALGVTVLEAGPCCVTRIRTKEKDGYTAVQLAFGSKKKQLATKAYIGQFKDLKNGEVTVPRFVREIRTSVLEGLEVGKEINAGLFKPKEMVDITGVTIGRGFQGVVKRHGFKGGGGHGAKFGRESGSIGQHTFPGRVFKGVRMAGHMGHVSVTQQNIQIVDVIADQNILIVKGAVPGPENALLKIQTSVKKGDPRRDWSIPEYVPPSKEEEEHVRPAGKARKEKGEKDQKKEGAAKKVASEKPEKGEAKKGSK